MAGEPGKVSAAQLRELCGGDPDWKAQLDAQADAEVAAYAAQGRLGELLDRQPIEWPPGLRERIQEQDRDREAGG
jgi:hypothetical protein